MNSGKGNAVVQKPRNYVHMPPELLVNIDIPIDVLKSFYLLPSLMHRLESLMLASQLRGEIGSLSSNSLTSSSLVCVLFYSVDFDYVDFLMRHLFLSFI